MTKSKDTPPNLVTLFLRKPSPSAFSIERVFQDVRSALPVRYRTRVHHAPRANGEPFGRIWNLVDAARNQSEINHITGDIHYIALGLSSRRTVLTIHDCNQLRELRGLRKHVYRTVMFSAPARSVRAITTVSQATKSELVRVLSVDPDRITVIHNPVSSLFRPSPRPFHQSRPVLLFIGTAPNKNLSRIAAALERVRCHLRIVGRPTAEQTALLTRCKIDFSVTHALTPEQLRSEYQGCDVVVFPSLHEGFGLPIVEGQAVGRPVVTSNTSSMPEVAGEGALLVDPLDTLSIRDGISKVIGDDALRARLIAAGHINVERFAPDRIAGAYARVYDNISS